MYWMHGNEEHNPKAIDYRRSEKIGARSSQLRGRKKSKGHALGMFSLACCLMRFLGGVSRQYGGVARVRGKKATHS